MGNYGNLILAGSGCITQALVHGVSQIQMFHKLDLYMDARQSDHIRCLAFHPAILRSSSGIRESVIPAYRRPHSLTAFPFVPRCFPHHLSVLFTLASIPAVHFI